MKDSCFVQLWDVANDLEFHLFQICESGYVTETKSFKKHLCELAILKRQCVVGSFSQVWLVEYIILAVQNKI